jgi:predicted CoA-binding protein
MQINKSKVDKILNSRNIAIAGISRNEKKFGNYIFNQLKEKGKIVFPVSPYLKEYKNQKCFSLISDLPDEVGSIIFVTKPEITNQLLKSVIEKGIKNIWFQQGSSDQQTLKMLDGTDINFVYNECVLMYAEPVSSFHKFHKIIWKLFGKYAT